MSNRPTKHMQDLCKELGDQYFITTIDGELVISRDFGNGYDVEISGVNTSSLTKSVTIYLWKNKNVIEKTLEHISQHSIGDYVEGLYHEVKNK